MPATRVQLDVNPAIVAGATLVILVTAVHLPVAFGALLGTIAMLLTYPLARHATFAVAQVSCALIAGHLGATTSLADLAILATVAISTYVWRLSMLGTNTAQHQGQPPHATQKHPSPQ